MPKGYLGTVGPHGSPWTYGNHGCRCAACSEAHAAYMRDYLHRTGRTRPKEVYLAERYAELPPHGTETRYTSLRTRCRCDECREASRQARARRRDRGRVS